jgi:hypothetical protein
MRRFVVVAVVIGCGRIGFEQHVAGDGSPADLAIDGPPARLVQVLAPGYGSAASMSIVIDETAGDLVVAPVYWHQDPDTVTLTDTAGLAWQSRPAVVVPGCITTNGNATGAQLYYAQVAATGTNTVTVTQTSGVQPLGLMLVEYANAMASVDAFSMVMAPASSNAMAATPITTSVPAVVIGFFNDTIGGGNDGSGSGFTAEARDTGFPNIVEDTIGPPGLYSPTATLFVGGNDACWVAFAIAFPVR